MLDDAQRQHQLDKGVRRLAEDQEPLHHGRRPQLQAQRQQETQGKQRRQQPQRLQEVQLQIVRGGRGGGNDRPDRQVVEGDGHRGDQHGERNADQARHRAQRQIFMVVAVQHDKPDGDQVHDAGAGGVTHQHGDDPHVAVGGDGVGQLIAAHVHGDHRQRGDRGVGAERREEGADAVHDQVRDDRDRRHNACRARNTGPMA